MPVLILVPLCVLASFGVDNDLYNDPLDTSLDIIRKKHIKRFTEP